MLNHNVIMTGGRAHYRSAARRNMNIIAPVPRYVSSYMLHAEAIIRSTSPLIAAERLIGGCCPPSVGGTWAWAVKDAT